MDRQSASQYADPVFVSLGMLVLDELHFPFGETLRDVPGGSGLYSTFGARLFKQGKQSPSIGFPLLVGNDFPKDVLLVLQSWGITLRVHTLPDQPSTRGLLEYEDNAFGRKSFAYMHPQLQPKATYLADSSLLRAKAFHTLALPQDLIDQVSTLLRLRVEHGVTERPLIVWEPSPLGCDCENYHAHLAACKLVDVFSPNHLELSYLLRGKTNTNDTVFSRNVVEEQAKRFLLGGVGIHGRGIVVVRAGEHGCLTLSNSKADWLPPFYAGNGISTKIVDPTGAGNAFLGAFTVALQEFGDSRAAAIRGTVAASYAMEQFGIPRLTPPPAQLSEEAWNGSSAATREALFRERIGERHSRVGVID